MLLQFDDFFTCFIAQKPLYLHLQGCFLNGLQSHLYGIEIFKKCDWYSGRSRLQSHFYGIDNEVFLIKKRKTTIVSYFVFGQKSGIQVTNAALNYTFLLPGSFNNAIRSGRCFS